MAHPSLQKLLFKYFEKCIGPYLKTGYSLYSVFDDICKKYDSKNRYFHNLNHIHYIIKRIDFDYPTPCKERTILLLTAFFHDVIYEPNINSGVDNEEESANYLLTFCELNEIIDKVKDLIIDTKYRKLTMEYAKNFHLYDFGDLVTGDNIQNIIKSDYNIFKEYQTVPFDMYKHGRLNFLKDLRNGKYNIELTEKAKQINEFQQQYLENWRPSIGVYAGSFNPFHIGHYNILQKASKIFDKVILVFGKNNDKQTIQCAFDARLLYNYYEVIRLPDDKLLTTLLKELERDANITLIRGLRDSFDLAYETNQIRFLMDLYPELKTVNIICDKEFSHISSSNIRKLINLKVDVSKYLINENS